MLRPTLINLNPIELRYYPFMINLDKCNVSCNVLSPKVCVSKEKKDKNVKIFNVITNKNKAKTMTNKFHVIANANSIVRHIIQIKNGIIKHVNVNVKIFYMQKRL